MCGLFGFSGDWARAEHLMPAIESAQRRGPHGTGLFYDGIEYRRLGRADPSVLACSGGSRLIIGHTRLATFGSHDDLQALQPVVKGDLVYAHNGNVYNWKSLSEKPAPSDSFALADLLSNGRIDQTVDRIETEAMALAVHDKRGTYLYRRRLPLHVLTAPEGTYWCSWPLDGWRSIPEDEVFCL